MRKIWKLRRIFIPQMTTIVILLISIVLAPHRGNCATVQTKTENPAIAEEASITTTYETDISGNALVVKTYSTTQNKGKASKPVLAEEKAPAAAALNVDASVHTALKKMNLSAEHIRAWISEHPDSTLKNLTSLPVAKQRKVANVATFIRSINRNISPKTAWREASALVYYSMKYGVPTELSVGVAKMESRFNPSAMSGKGACGVMQVMWKVHSGMLSAKGIATKKDHMFDPERGVESGVLILSRYINAYGTVQKALNRYYGGISTAYLKKVNNSMAMLARHSDNTGF